MMTNRPTSEQIVACLEAEYDLRGVNAEYLPVGADADSCVFRMIDFESSIYFVKLRRRNFAESSAELPNSLHAQGILQIIPPIQTKSGRFCTRFDDFLVTLYPFVEGCDAYEIELQTRHWNELGRAIRHFHNAVLTQKLRFSIPTETFSGEGREYVRNILTLPLLSHGKDETSQKLVEFLSSKRNDLLELIHHAE